MTERVAPHHSSAKTDAGFTLVEMLVALALLALMLASMPSALRLGLRALSAAEDLERAAARQAATDFMEQRLVQASPIYEHRADGRSRVAFRGDATSVTFIAPAASGATSSLYSFEFKAATDVAGRNGVAASFASYRPGSDRPDSRAPRQERLLLPETGVAFRYFGAATPRSAPQWNEVWDATDNLPELVEVRLMAARSGTSRVLLVPLRLRPQR